MRSRIFIRTLRFGVHVVKGLITEAWLFYRNGADWHTNQKGRRAIRRWMAQLCNILDMEVVTNGKVCDERSTLFVANHISWLDVIGLNSVIDTRFIAKSNVKAWPVLGTLTTAAGTMFITRDRRSALRQAIATISHALGKGSNVVIFPEGTTTVGDTVEAFHNGLLQVAIESNCCVQAITLRYRREGVPDRIAPFIGDDTFVSHLLRVFSKKGLKLELDFGATYSPPFSDRRRIADDVRQSILSRLQ